MKTKTIGIMSFTVSALIIALALYNTFAPVKNFLKDWTKVTLPYPHFYGINGCPMEDTFSSGVGFYFTMAVYIVIVISSFLLIAKIVKNIIYEVSDTNK